MDYGTLKTTLESYLHRDDLTDLIPTFIQLAQSRMTRDLKTHLLQTTGTVSLTGGTATASLPSDYASLISIRVPWQGGVRTLQQHSLVQNAQVFEELQGSSGSPLYYAIYNNSTLEITPTPESSVDLQIIYQQRLAAFTLDADTDAILTQFPNIYIYASMLEAAPFIQDDDQIAKWGKFYQGEVDSLNKYSEDAQWSGAPMQIKSLGTSTP